MGDSSDSCGTLAIVVAGLRRFADEGVLNWSRENAERLFHPSDLDDRSVRQILQNWHDLGAIILIGTDIEFMRVVDVARLAPS